MIQKSLFWLYIQKYLNQNLKELSVLLCSLQCYFYYGFSITIVKMLPMWHSGKESACQCRRHKRGRFNPWVGKIPWRRKWQPTPVFLLRESHGQRTLVGYSPRGHKESDMTECAFTCLNIWKCDLPLTIIIIILFPQHFPNSPCLFISFSSFNKFLKVFWLELPWIYALIYIMPL